MPVDETTSADIMAVLQPIWNERAVTAGRVRQRVGAVMRRIIAQGHRPDNPAGDLITAALEACLYGCLGALREGARIS